MVHRAIHIKTAGPKYFIVHLPPKTLVNCFNTAISVQQWIHWNVFVWHCFSSGYWGLEGGQNKTSSCFPLMVIVLFAWSFTMIAWTNPHKCCTIMEFDWRTHFLGDVIINCCLSGKLGRVQISWIPVTLQTDWRLSDSDCCGALSVASVFHASWLVQSGDFSQALTECLTCLFLFWTCSLTVFRDTMRLGWISVTLCTTVSFNK